jgi:hypothetical protein
MARSASQPVVSRTPINIVVIVACRDKVRTAVSKKMVITTASPNAIVVVAAEDVVDIGATNERIFTRLTEQAVFAASTFKAVIASAAKRGREYVGFVDKNCQVPLARIRSAARL